MEKEFYLKKIKQEFPEIKWKTYRQINHGWDHLIFVLDNKTIFRFPKDKEYRNKFWDEIQLLEYLKQKVNVQIPEYTYISKDKTIAGYKMLLGDELTLSRFQKLSSQEKNKIAQTLATFLTILHSTPKSIIKKYRVPQEDPRKEYSELVKIVRKFIYPKITQKDIESIEIYFRQLKKTLDDTYQEVLIHNDLTSDHILLDTKKKVKIIDFSDRALADPAIDFAGLFGYGIKFTKKVFDLYSGKKDQNFLNRAYLYFKRIPLSIMKASLKGQNAKFEDGYTLFKKRFHV